MEVLDFTKDVFGLFIDTLYGLNLAWDALPLATIFGLYRLADKYLVTSLRDGILEHVMSSEVDSEDLEDMLRDVDGDLWGHHGEFAEAVTRPIVERLEEVEWKVADLKNKVEQHSTRYMGAPVKLSEELADILGTDEIPRFKVGKSSRNHNSKHFTGVTCFLTAGLHKAGVPDFPENSDAAPKGVDFADF